MKPYYEHAGITIYHGDCREILPGLPKCDLLLTDPPYGIQGGRGGTSKQRMRGNYEGAFTAEQDTPELIRDVIVPAIQLSLSLCTAGIVTPGNKNLTLYPQPESFGCLYQPASSGAQHWGWADSQPIFYYGRNPAAGLRLEACSFILRTHDQTDNGHPCPKPYSIWRRLLLKGSLEGSLVLDPFMGSGTTLRAAKDTGRRAIGIEIEEKYCEIAAKRLSQEVFQW